MLARPAMRSVSTHTWVRARPAFPGLDELPGCGKDVHVVAHAAHDVAHVVAVRVASAAWKFQDSVRTSCFCTTLPHLQRMSYKACEHVGLAVRMAIKHHHCTLTRISILAQEKRSVEAIQREVHPRSGF